MNTLQAEVLRLKSENLQPWWPSGKLAAMNFATIFGPHSVREMEDASLKSWSRCKWMNISLDLLPQVVEDWTLLTPP